jgi:hypothetical protein
LLCILRETTCYADNGSSMRASGRGWSGTASEELPGSLRIKPLK